MCNAFAADPKVSGGKCEALQLLIHAVYSTAALFAGEEEPFRAWCDGEARELQSLENPLIPGWVSGRSGCLRQEFRVKPLGR
jgi:hypothetical protein